MLGNFKTCLNKLCGYIAPTYANYDFFNKNFKCLFCSCLWISLEQLMKLELNLNN